MRCDWPAVSSWSCSFNENSYSANTYENGDLICRVFFESKLGFCKGKNVSEVFAQEVLETYPSEEVAYRFWDDRIWMFGNDKVFEVCFTAIASDYFKFFSFRFLKGDPSTALAEGGMVITEALGRHFFESVAYPITLTKRSHIRRDVDPHHRTGHPIGRFSI